jgi:hypothetical protein
MIFNIANSKRRKALFYFNDLIRLCRWQVPALNTCLLAGRFNIP